MKQNIITIFRFLVLWHLLSALFGAYGVAWANVLGFHTKDCLNLWTWTIIIGVGFVMALYVKLDKRNDLWAFWVEVLDRK